MQSSTPAGSTRIVAARQSLEGGTPDTAAEYPFLLSTANARWWHPLAGVVVLLVAWAIPAGVAAKALSALGGDPNRGLRALDVVAVALPIALMIPGAVAAVVLAHRLRPGVLLSAMRRPRAALFVAGLAVAIPAFLPMALAKTAQFDSEPSPTGGAAGWIGWHPFLSYFVAIVLVFPLQAAAEEIVFRGYLTQAVASWTRRAWPAAVASSLMFVAIHNTHDGWIFADRFFFGMALFWLCRRTGGLEAAIALHVTYNVLLGLGVAATGRMSSMIQDSRSNALCSLTSMAGTAVAVWTVARWAQRTGRVASNAKAPVSTRMNWDLLRAPEVSARSVAVAEPAPAELDWNWTPPPGPRAWQLGVGRQQQRENRRAPINASPRPAVGATEVAARSLAPDLARGAMLLLIALGNAHLFLYEHRAIGFNGYPIATSIAERVDILLQMTFADGRDLPFFAFLFGYGTVQLCRRLSREGSDETAVRRLIRRRGWCMVLLGFLHALLLFAGDIIAAYGLLAVVLAGVVARTSDRKLLIAVGLGTVPIMAIGAWGTMHEANRHADLPLLRSLSITDPLAAVGARIGDWLPLTITTALIAAAPPMLLGVWAARRRILDEPERHRPLLVRVAVIGLGLGYLGGLPLALTAARWSAGSSPSASTAMAGLAHNLTGYTGAIGYAALAGIVAIRLRDRPGRVAAALAACGQRSMTCYLLQSVVFVAVLAAYGGGLGNRLGVVATAVLAVATWVLCVVVAEVMSRRGYRGPAEVALRRLTYRQTP